MLTKQLLDQIFRRASGAPFAVTFWNGGTTRYGCGEPRFALTFHEPVDLLQGDLALAFGEAYMNGKIDVQGDLADMIEMASRNQAMLAAGWAPRALQMLGGVAGRGKRSLSRQKNDIAHHYDLGNDFFNLWLDESHTYSCAYFRSPDDALEQAQQQKIDHSLRKLRLKEGESLLDIGCGWGALAMRAAEQFGTRTLGITLSEEQHAAANDAIRERGLEEKVEVLLAPYQKLAKEGRQFDKIVSIGMIEHVGQAHLPDFVRAVQTLLKPGGLALLHTITITGEQPINSWIDKYIFPGAYVPTLSEMTTRLYENGLPVHDVENLRPHYRMTLDRWSERFERALPEVRQMFDAKFERMWRLYLRSCAAGFAEGTLEVQQMLVSNGKPSALPLTRDDIYRDFDTHVAFDLTRNGRGHQAPALHHHAGL